MLQEERRYIRWMETLTNDEVALAGGKNASLGELMQALGSKGIQVPNGFVVTADGYREFIAHNELEVRIREQLNLLSEHKTAPGDAERKIRHLIFGSEFPPRMKEEITATYLELSHRYGEEGTDVAVRSSATAEDLPDASFAGQHESFLGVSGVEDVLYACRRCFASLFTDRAISYREQKGFDHMSIALSVGVQKMVRADLENGSSGVIFTLDTETGFPDAIVINASFGLGECVVQGTVTPDEYRLFKPLLSDESKRPIIAKNLGAKEIKMVYGDRFGNRVKTVNTPYQQRKLFVLNEEEIVQLARWAKTIEDHYQRPMDIEWARDGESGQLFILQARPETVHARATKNVLRSARLLEEGGRVLAEGQAIGSTIAAGKAVRLKNATESSRFKKGQVLVTSCTDPDWVPIMKKASAIVTDHGGRTSHAAIVSRELGVPAVIGTGDATSRIFEGQEVTVSCAGGEKGIVYAGLLEFEEHEMDLEEIPQTRTTIMLNIASPEAAFRWWGLHRCCGGIGLARMEFIIANLIRIHPMALARFDDIEDGDLRGRISRMTDPYEDKAQFFIDQLSLGLAHIAASCWPMPAIVRMSDFKTNEYASLVGGRKLEPLEENPMLGFRGASRYYSEAYREGFALECKAIKKAREEIGMDNIIVMIPFCRTLEEADRVLREMDSHGLRSGENGLQIYVMAEIPSNIILAAEFADRFDGFSIGSNDLTQLVLGVDRDSEMLGHLFDERDEAVKRAIRDLITAAHAKNCKVGICGQGPSDHPDFAEYLISLGIDSISLNPDSVIKVTKRIASLEEQQFSS